MMSDRNGRGLMDDSEYALAAALVELLARSPAALARLRDLVSVHEHVAPTAPAYTVASLARVVGVSPRAVRDAIARGELVAAKRGGRWIISDDAVRAWARAEPMLSWAPAFAVHAIGAY